MGEWGSVHWCWKFKWGRSLFVWDEVLLLELRNLVSSISLCKEEQDDWIWKVDNFFDIFN